MMRPLFIFTLLTITFNSWAQNQLNWKEIKESSGLPSNNAYKQLASEHGGMWLATEKGLGYFDGYRVQQVPLVQNNDTITSTPIYNVAYGPHGNLWLGSKEGLKIYNPNTQKLLEHPIEDKRVVESMLFVGADRVLVSFYSGFFDIKIDENGLPLESFEYSIEDYTKDRTNFINQFYLDNNEDIYISIIGTGILKGPLRNIQNWHLFDLLEIPFKTEQHPFSQVNSIEKYDNQNLLINFINEGLFRYNINSKVLINVPALSFLDDPGFTSISGMTMNQKVLFASQLGVGLIQADLSLLDQVNVKRYSFEAIPDFNFWDNIIYSVTVKDNIIWLCTKGDGVKYAALDNPGITTYPLNDYLDKNTSIYVVKTQNNNQLWVGTFGEGVLKVDLENGRFHSIVQYDQTNNILNLPSDSINDLYFAKDNAVWIATNKGLSLYNNGKKKLEAINDEGTAPDRLFLNSFIDKNSISSNSINYIFEDAKGSMFFTSNNGMNIYDGAGRFLNHINNQTQPFLKVDAAVYFSDFLADSSIVMSGPWLGALFRKGESMSYQTIFPTDDVVYISYSINSGKETSWLATDKGLYRYDAKTSRTVPFGGQAFFKNKKINSLIESKGHLWLGTSQGLYSYNLETEEINSFSLTSASGWPFFHYGSVDKDDNGNVYFGTNKGIVVVNPDRALAAASTCQGQCPIFVSSLHINQKKTMPQLQIGGEPQVVYAPMQIHYGDLVDFQLGFPSHHIEAGARVQYALSDGNWIDAGQSDPSVLLHRLSPGDYQLKFRAVSVAGKVIATSGMQVVVLAPWYARWWAYGLYAIGVLLLVFIGIRLKIQSVKRNESIKRNQAVLKKKQETNDLKFEFISNISHELRTPLTLILNDIESLKEKDTPAVSLDKLETNAKRLKRLANEMLDLKGVEKERMKLTVGQYDAIGFVKDIFALFEALAKKKRLEFNFETPDDKLMIWFNPHQFEKVIYNLLSNAFKFTPDGGKIEVKVYKNDTCGIDQERLYGFVECISIEVNDSGQGIEPENLDQLFDSDFSVAPQNGSEFDSAGIGLYLSKKIIDLHYGDIRAESALGVGTTFLVRIPIGHFHYDDDQLQVDNNQRAVVGLNGATQPNEAIAEVDFTNKKVLTIEDNVDINAFLTEFLQGRYKHTAAQNGVEGLEKAKSLVPDLIVTDLSMPGKNGLAVIKSLKKDVLLSHIPIIVLTSYAGDEKRVEVLNEGVDAFITKPFEKTVLLARINNLLLSRKQLKDLFSDGTSNFTDLVGQSPDSDFLKRIISIIDKNLADPEFDVAALAKNINASRSLLYNKIPSLTNYSPKDFIHVMRVRKAAKMLRSGQFRVNEVSDEVGYNTQKNFRKYFKEYFGIAPSEYLKNQSSI